MYIMYIYYNTSAEKMQDFIINVRINCTKPAKRRHIKNFRKANKNK